MSFLRAAWRNDAGNMSTMYALLAPILIFGVGGAIDYGRAAQIRSKLNAAADAAALAALTPAMLQQTSATARRPLHPCSKASPTACPESSRRCRRRP
ncbi:MAG TPA: pilus assembly protein TadG-related protein [Roseiarcus sp.]|nr:pilus assembly protein TadG-related protein [Roseiarcus sp.]